MIPFMDLDAQYKSIQNEIDEAIFKVIKSYNFINGPEVAAFEKKFAEIQNVKYCVGCSSGTSALHIAYEVVGITKGDEVIVPSMTFIATTEPLRQLGAIPVFADIDPISYNIDVSKIEECITNRTKAIVAVHLHGNPCDMDLIIALARKYNLKIIEDCAQSHLAEYKGVTTGNFGDIAAFSFYPGKNLGAYGDAGAIVTNNEVYYNLSKMLINHGRNDKYSHQIIGYNFRLDTLQAAILLVKLNYIKKWTDLRISKANKYSNLLKGTGIFIPEYSPQNKHVYHIYSLKSANRDAIIKELKNNHISFGVHYPIPLHLQPAYKSLGYKLGDLPVSERLANEFISLPLYTELEDKHIEFISKIIVETLKHL